MATGGRSRGRLENNVFPYIGDKPVKDISTRDVLLVFRRIEGRGAIETAHRVKTICSQVFRYSVACGLIPNDPCRDLKNALTPVTIKHMASITDPEQIGALMRAITDYKGHEVTRLALQFAPLVFVPANYERPNGPNSTLISPCGKSRLKK